jgi:elongation factor G
VLAHVFRIVHDPYAGKLSLFRVVQGTVRPGMELFIGEQKKPFKVAHLFRVHGAEHEDIDAAVPGDIAAVAKVDEIHYDAILHDHHAEDRFYLKPIDFPRPMVGLAVSPTNRGQEQKLATALAHLDEEDPCFHVEHHQELNETVIYGLGEMHLRLLLERLRERHGLDLETRPPRIAYRETITKAAEGHCRHKKQTGGAGQFGEVFLRVRPLARGEGFRFRSEVVGGAIPTGLIPAVEKGVRQALDEGVLAGFPVQDLEVTVYDGKHHSVDSKEIAFVIAGRKAFSEAVEAAGPQILEPIADLEVTMPEAHVGDITGALAGHRARILGSESLPDGQAQVSAAVPVAELEHFPMELKRLTGGEGRYTMAFSHYDPVPPQEQQALIDAQRRDAAD